jgi:signal transduction histidine kinase
MISFPSWWRRRSLRARLTIVTTAGLAVALVVAAAAVWVILFSSLIHGLDNTARQGAREVAALADRHRLPNPVPVAGGTLTIQVLNSSGRIIDASPLADLMVPLLPPAQASANARTGRAVLLNGRPYGIPSELRVVAVRAPRAGYTIVAAVSFSSVIDSVSALSHALLLVTPVLLLLLAWVVWLVVGSALRPIAGLRRGAQEVTATGRPRALPVPEARDEVHSLAVTLNDMLARLEASQQRQRSLVSDTAHELRSPIASIRAQLEVALDHPEQQEWPGTAADVLADTLRLGRLAEDLLVLARLDECDTRPASRRGTQPVDLAALVTAEVRRAAGTRVPVLASAPRPCLVLGDAEGLRRILLNLVENAVRYAKSKVDVSVTAEGGEVLLTVTDDGPGIREADRERAFGRFVRLDEARSREDDGAGGAGLGLAIVQALARSYGGRAELADASPGLRAVARLPAAPAIGGE